MKRILIGLIGIMLCSMALPKLSVAEDLKMAIGLALPPYVLSGTNSGIELDIVTHILASQGYSIVPKYVNFGSVGKQLQHGKVQGALTITDASGIKNIFYSNEHITYQNVVVSLKQNALSIKKIEDLSKYKVIAFQDATKYLGAAYVAAIKKSPHYLEIAKQETQVARLFKKSTQAIIMDINIFKYFRQNTKKIDTSAEVQIDQIFPPSPYKVGFVDKNIRDKFNVGLAAFDAGNMYDQIYKKYINN